MEIPRKQTVVTRAYRDASTRLTRKTRLPCLCAHVLGSNDGVDIVLRIVCSRRREKPHERYRAQRDRGVDLSDEWLRGDLRSGSWVPAHYPGELAYGS